MNIKPLFAAFILSTTLLLYCKSPSKPPETVPIGDNSQTSLDWAGVYAGVLPCADCEGIQTEVQLTNELNYILKTKYLGKDDNIIQSTGSFVWNKQGNTITLTNTNQPVRYFVGENTLTQLDMNGNKITGDLASKYVLRKTDQSSIEK